MGGGLGRGRSRKYLSAARVSSAKDLAATVSRGDGVDLGVRLGPLVSDDDEIVETSDSLLRAMASRRARSRASWSP